MEFLILVAAYKNSQKPGFVPPIVNNREIDLYTVSAVRVVPGASRQCVLSAGVAGKLLKDAQRDCHVSSPSC
jgi:hypothetical protein